MSRQKEIFANGSREETSARLANEDISKTTSCLKAVAMLLESVVEYHDDDDFTRLLNIVTGTVLVDETNDGSTRRWRTPDLDEDVGYE